MANASSKYDHLAARQHINTLTYNRITARTGKLTPYQLQTIDYVVQQQAQWEYEHRDLIDSILSSYSLNGVSMTINVDGWNLYTQGGVVIRRDLYEQLKTTGLCSRVI
jgi:hypothetical protein